MIEGRRTSLAQLKKHPVLILWLATQLGIVGYVLWMTEVKGWREPHVWRLLVPTFGVLLFPGVQIVVAVLGVVFWIARQFGWLPPPPSTWMGIPFWLAVWGASAWLTYTIWSWALQRIKGSAVSDRIRTARTSPASSANSGASVLLTLWWVLMTVLGGSVSVALTAYACELFLFAHHGWVVAIFLLAVLAGSAALVLSHIWLLAALRCMRSDVHLVPPFGVLAVCTVLGDMFVIPWVWRLAVV